MKVNTQKILVIVASVLIIYVLNLIYIVKRDNSLTRLPVISPTPTPTPQPPPCGGSPASKIELGRVYGVYRPSAEFTTTGGEIFIVARNMDTSGLEVLFRSLGAKDHVEILIGFADSLHNGNDSIPDVGAKSIVKLLAFEDEFTQVNLAQGRYWLWTSEGADIDIISCHPNGVTDPVSFPQGKYPAVSTPP